MKKYILVFILLAIYALGSQSQKSETAAGSNNTNNTDDSNRAKKPKMQVVFALDATGSMGGLINAAKEKIWSIVSSLSQTETTPDIEVGLIFYRYRGDEFVTKRIPLSDSIDLVYAELMNINADGGGDGPESVNQGLNEAVELFNWDKDNSTYKAVFLVGDYEPHMNYRNDVPYFVTCGIAKSKDIVLNTILMGNNQKAAKVWQEIARCNEGAFVNVNMKANDITVFTPYDSAIAVINDQLDNMQYYYGSASVKQMNYSYMATGKSNAGLASVTVKAQRAEFNALISTKKIGTIQNELLKDLASGNVSLDSIKKEELPDEFKKLSKDSIAVIVKQKAHLRDSLQKELQTAINKRNAYIDADLAKRNAGEVEGSFNNIIFKSIQKQTQKKKIVIKGTAKY